MWKYIGTYDPRFPEEDGPAYAGPPDKDIGAARAAVAAMAAARAIPEWAALVAGDRSEAVCTACSHAYMEIQNHRAWLEWPYMQSESPELWFAPERTAKTAAAPTQQERWDAAAARQAAREAERTAYVAAQRAEDEANAALVAAVPPAIASAIRAAGFAMTADGGRVFVGRGPLNCWLSPKLAQQIVVRPRAAERAIDAAILATYKEC